jgi:hypothetical protein
MKTDLQFVGMALAFAACTVAPAAHGQTLINLTTVGATVQDGNAACPDQPYYLYSGGKKDNFAGTADRAYPRPSLVASFPPTFGLVDYDVVALDDMFGDSFNLQNNRSVCYAVIELRVTGISAFTTDSIGIGHWDPVLGWKGVAGILSPASSTGVQKYSLTGTGLSLLSAQIGGGSEAKTAEDAILDVTVQDDTRLDYFKMWVWYGKNCRETGSC